MLCRAFKHGTIIRFGKSQTCGETNLPQESDGLLVICATLEESIRSFRSRLSSNLSHVGKCERSCTTHLLLLDPANFSGPRRGYGAPRDGATQLEAKLMFGLGGPSFSLPGLFLFVLCYLVCFVSAAPLLLFVFPCSCPPLYFAAFPPALCYVFQLFVLRQAALADDLGFLVLRQLSSFRRL